MWSKGLTFKAPITTKAREVCHNKSHDSHLVRHSSFKQNGGTSLKSRCIYLNIAGPSISAYFRKVTECVKFSYKNTTHIAENKASNMAISVTLLNYHALSIVIIIIILFWCLLDGLIVLVLKHKHVHAVYCKTVMVEYCVN